MVGIIIVTHGQLARELILITEFITGKVVGIEAVTTDPKMSVAEIKEDISRAVKKVDRGKGVLILTDMFGGTPSTISFSFLQDNRIEVVTGVNLPMLLKLSTHDSDMPLGELAEFIKSYGQKNINVASEILRKGSKQDGNGRADIRDQE